MPDTLSSAAQKVQDILRQRGYDCKVVEMPDSTRTAVDAANAVGCEVGQIVKSLIFRSESGKGVLVTASGPNRVNEAHIASLLGEKIKRADPEFVREQTGFAIGGVPPLGHALPMCTFIDEDLLTYADIWAAAGTPHAVFCLKPDQLVEMTGGQVVSVK